MANIGTASFDTVTVAALAAPPADKPIADLNGGKPDDRRQAAVARTSRVRRSTAALRTPPDSSRVAALSV